jgi:hypothetical protein
MTQQADGSTARDLPTLRTREPGSADGPPDRSSDGYRRLWLRSPERYGLAVYKAASFLRRPVSMPS